MINLAIVLLLKTNSNVPLFDVSNIRPQSALVQMVEPLPQPDTQPMEEVALQPEPPPPPAPTPVTPASVAAPSGCVTGVVTGNFYEDFIISHESGGNTCARNPSSGACNLFQEYPCGKSGCSLADVACELAWGEGYATSRYGGWPQAYAYWVAHSNW